MINLEITNDLGFEIQDPWEHQDPVPSKPRSFSSSTPASVKPPAVARTASSLSDPAAGHDEWGSFAIKPNVVAGAKNTMSVPNTPLAATMSKEDRAAEMARRKEERRQVRVTSPLLSFTLIFMSLPAHCNAEREEAGQGLIHVVVIHRLLSNVHRCTVIKFQLIVTPIYVLYTSSKTLQNALSKLDGKPWFLKS